MNGKAWTQEEDDELLRLRAQNVPFGVIAKRYIPRHSQKACECRYQRAKDKLVRAADGTTITAGAAAAAAVAASSNGHSNGQQDQEMSG